MRLLLFWFAFPVFAHTLSVSTGELTIDGAVATYRIVLPAHELDHIREPERTILDAIQIRGARVSARSCVRDGESYMCEGKYVFASPPETIVVEARLADAVVNNHVHVLTARRSGLVARAVFNQAQTSAELRFEPEGASGVRWHALGAGVLVALAASLSGFYGVIAFVAGAICAFFLPSGVVTPAFASAALAITAAWAAVEALLLKRSRFRWIPACATGVAFGVYAGDAITVGSAALVAGIAAVLFVRWRRPIAWAVIAGSAVWLLLS